MAEENVVGTCLNGNCGKGRFGRSVLDMLGLDTKYLNGDSYSPCPMAKKIVQKRKQFTSKYSL